MAMHRTVSYDGVYRFRLFPNPYWDTTSLPNGRYRLHILAWDGRSGTEPALGRRPRA